MAMRCRYGDLVFVAALLGGTDPEIVSCAEPAGYKAIVATDNGGFVIEVTTPVCPVHEAHLSYNPGFKRSIKLRDPVAT